MLYAAKAEADAVENAEFAGNLELKLAVLDDAEKLLTETDRVVAKDKLLAIQRRWDAIGKVPRDNVKAVEDRLRKVETYVRKLDEDHWNRTDPEKQARSEGLAAQLDERDREARARARGCEGRRRQEADRGCRGGTRGPQGLAGRARFVASRLPSPQGLLHNCSCGTSVEACPRSTSATPAPCARSRIPCASSCSRFLRRDGAHSVGELSELADVAPGSVSYHLGTLEKHGFVEEAPELARDGRERWWRATHASTHYNPGQLNETPESRAASLAFRQAILQGHLVEQLAYLESEPALPRDWVDAATSGDTLAYLTVEELAEFSAEVTALAAKWDRPRTAARDGTGRSASSTRRSGSRRSGPAT